MPKETIVIPMRQPTVNTLYYKEVMANFPIDDIDYVVKLLQGLDAILDETYDQAFRDGYIAALLKLEIKMRQVKEDYEKNPDMYYTDNNGNLRRSYKFYDQYNEYDSDMEDKEY